MTLFLWLLRRTSFGDILMQFLKTVDMTGEYLGPEEQGSKSKLVEDEEESQGEAEERVGRTSGCFGGVQ